MVHGDMFVTYTNTFRITQLLQNFGRAVAILVLPICSETSATRHTHFMSKFAVRVGYAAQYLLRLL